jgi:hypothetical protein
MFSMNFIKKLWIKILIQLKSILLWVIVISVILLFSAYSIDDQPTNAFLKTSLMHIASALLTGAALGSIIRSSQFSDIFADQLREIVYSKESLINRKDLNQIWDTASKALYQSKFPKISDKIHKIITEVYFPTNHQYYQESFVYDITIDKLDNDYIKLTELDTTIIVPYQKNVKIKYEFSLSIDIPETEDPNLKTHYCLDSFEINGKNELDPSIIKIEDDFDNNLKRVTVSKTLEGEKKYIITKKETKIYSIDANPYKKHSLKYFTRKCNITINFPSDHLKIVFTGIGTYGFKEVQQSVKKYNQLIMKCNELLFPKNGFIIIYQKKLTSTINKKAYK